MPAAMMDTPLCCLVPPDIWQRPVILQALPLSYFSLRKKVELAAKAMVDDGLMERFGIEEVYGLHNMPGMAVGEFAICEGPIMASTDEFTITLKGKGRSCGTTHAGIDPLLPLHIW